MRWINNRSRCLSTTPLPSYGMWGRERHLEIAQPTKNTYISYLYIYSANFSYFDAFDQMPCLFQTIYDDIQSNSKIGALLPSLVSFIRTGMQRHCDNQTLVGRLLCLIQALFNNPMLNLTPKPYVSVR